MAAEAAIEKAAATPVMSPSTAVCSGFRRAKAKPVRAPVSSMSQSLSQRTTFPMNSRRSSLIDEMNFPSCSLSWEIIFDTSDLSSGSSTSFMNRSYSSAVCRSRFSRNFAVNVSQRNFRISRKDLIFQSGTSSAASLAYFPQKR